MAVGDIMEIGKQGLAANRQALQTTSNNIANANTPGYTRQRPVFQANAQSQAGGVYIGGGVDVPRVVRVHDAFVERQLTDETKLLGGARMRADGLKHMESLLYHEGFQVNELVNKFFDGARELSTNPESQAARALVIEGARGAVDGFRNAADSLRGMRRDLDLRLGQMTEEVNQKTRELATLNEKISFQESAGNSPNELLDRRDVLVRELTQKLGYGVASDERGQVSFTGTGLGSVVVGNQANELVVMRTGATDGKAAGAVDIFVKDSFGLHRVTETFTDGEFAGLLHVRDNVITETLDRLDHAAYQFSQSVNEVHGQGFGRDSEKGRALFGDLTGPKDAAANIRLSEGLTPDTIGAALQGDAPGDNRIALAIADLQNKALLPTNGIVGEGAELHHTLGESLNALMGNIASRTANEDSFVRHQEAIVNQLQNYRESIAGVSLEEEAINMIQYQAVFNASAKTMKMGDELLDTILSLKR